MSLISDVRADVAFKRCYCSFLFYITLLLGGGLRGLSDVSTLLVTVVLVSVSLSDIAQFNVGFLPKIRQ